MRRWRVQASIWDDPAAVERLRDLAARGLSADQIAWQIGDISRNAIIGKCSRLGIALLGMKRSHAGSPKAKPSTPRPPSKPRNLFRAAAAAAPDVPRKAFQEIPALVLENGKHVTTEMLRGGMCRWPIGDPQQAGFHYCAHEQHRPSSYCKHHLLAAYRRAPPELREAMSGKQITA